MGLPAPLASLLAELQRVLSHLSIPNHSSEPDNVPSAPFTTQSSLYPVPLPHSSTPRLNPVPAHPPIAPLPGSTTTSSSRSFTEVIRESILSQPVVRPSNRPFKTGCPDLDSRSHRVSSKLSHLRALSKKGIPVCYRCGASGHHTVSCRNALVCFACAKTGHRSGSCSSQQPIKLTLPPILAPPKPLPDQHKPPPLPACVPLSFPPPALSSSTISPPPALSSSTFSPPPIPTTLHTPALKMLPPPAPALLVESNILPIMRYYATSGTIAFRNSLAQGVVFRDLRHLGPAYIQACLHFLFPFPNWTWIARELPDQHYLVAPPSVEWRDEMIRAGEMSFGGISFAVMPYDFRFFNGGILLKEYWIRVFGYPQDLWRDTELRQLARDLGGIYLASDPQSSMIALRIKIGVPDKEVISACRRLLFTDVNGLTHSHIIQVQVEDDVLPPWGSTRLSVFDTSLNRARSISPLPTVNLTDTVLTLAQPSVEIPDTVTASANLIPVDLNSAAPIPVDLNISTHLSDTLLPHPVTYSDSHLPNIASPPIPLPILSQPDVPVPLQDSATIASAQQSDVLPIVQEVLTPAPDVLPLAASAVSQPPVVPAVDTASEETRHSLRLKMKELKSGSSRNMRANKSSSHSGNDIIQQFPYINLSDQEIISLFDVSGLCLGSSTEERLKVVAHLRSLSRSRFSTVCIDLIPSRPSHPPVDISQTILSITSELPPPIND